MDRILIRDLVVHAIIGIHDHERDMPRPIVINLDIGTDVSAASESDDIADCIDYEKVVEKLTTHTVVARRTTVEALAADLARIILLEPGVDRVLVRVEKPGAVATCRSVGVEIERRRTAPG